MPKYDWAYYLDRRKCSGVFRAVTTCCCCRRTVTYAGSGGTRWLCDSCVDWLPGAKVEFDEMKARLEGLEK